MSSTFVGGKLKLKGDNNAKKKRKRVSSGNDNHENLSVEKATPSSLVEIHPDDYLTEAEKKYKEKKTKADSRAAKKITQLTYRERLETFNQRLASTTEHNDIPRISAAGNG